MSDKKLTPEARDKLAQKLRSNLGRSRPRPWLWALAGLLATGVVLWGLWKGSQAPPPLPPLLLTLADALNDDEIEAQLTAPGHPEAKLEGLTVHWKISTRHWGREGDAKTDAHGIARFRRSDGKSTHSGPIPAVKIYEETIEAWHLDPTDRSRRRDARAILLTGGERVLVSIDDLVDKNVDWLKTPINEVPTPALMPAKGRIVVAAGPVDVDTYQAMRGWLGRLALAPRPILLKASIEDMEKRTNSVRWKPGEPGPK